MKLELKHLAPYLPYGLKVTKENWIRIGTLVSWVTFEDGLQIELDYAITTQAKPILRPLSDLSRSGDDKILINEHTINMLISDLFNLEYGAFGCYKNELSIILFGDSDLRYDQDKPISFDVFFAIQNELLKAHYDIFGLIDKGLAIDINDLND